MRIRKKMVLAAAGVILGISVTYGYFSDIVSVTNHISTGDVNIRLQEYQQKNGKEILYSNPKLVMPGDIVSKIPRISNLAEPCWIRAKISYENDRKELESLSDGDILGISEQWVKQGEYFYYTRILEQGEAATLFRAVKIPDDWTEKHSSQKLHINIQADAIQAANFQPDFRAMSPWGNQEIELCVHEENGRTLEEKKKVKLSVEFNGNAHKLIAVPDDFFANIQRAMPGDSFQDSVEISNTTDKPAELFFHTGIVCQREDRMDLLKKLSLTIAMNGKSIYSGNLLAEELKSEVSLGIFQSGEEGTMEFTVSVPKELKNAYALRDGAVKWYFTVYEEESAPGVTPKDRENPESPTWKQNQETNQSSSVKTGDESPVSVFLFAAMFSVVSGTIVLLVKKGGKKQ